MNRLDENQKALLSLTANALFGTPLSLSEEIDWNVVFSESFFQTVSPMVYPVAAPYLPKDINEKWKKQITLMAIKNAQVAFEHGEVHRLMKKNGIPYTIIKGVASASYYKDPTVRTMGDVDFLVHEKDMDKADGVIQSLGFAKAEHDEEGGIHIAYKRPPKSTWEMHRTLNGIPNGNAGDKCREYLSDTIETAKPYRSDASEMMIPDEFHHGLILLLHTASHLTSSGVGLRHLCDWAVFEASFSNDEFCDMFEEKLKECGLWQFAKLLTLTCSAYLGSPKKAWIGEADEELLESMICDILSGGNFGQKDDDRTRQIKYISNRGEHTVDSKGVVSQALKTLSEKAKDEGKSKPAVIGEYLKKVIKKERRLDSKKTLDEARERKNIYQSFRLFETE